MENITSANVNPYEALVRPDTDTVYGQISKITAEDSPLIQRARAKAAMGAAGRGLSNTSLAMQAGETAVLDAAMPIATADAGTYSQERLANQQAQNNALIENARFLQEANKFNAESNNTADLSAFNVNSQRGTMGYGAGLDLSKMGYQGLIDAGLMNQQGMIDLAKMGYGSDIDLTKMGFGSDIDLTKLGYQGNIDQANMGYGATLDMSKMAFQGSIDLSKMEYGAEIDFSKLNYEAAVKMNELAFSANVDMSKLSYINDLELGKIGYTDALDRNKMILSGQIKDHELTLTAKLTADQMVRQAEIDRLAREHANALQQGNMVLANDLQMKINAVQNDWQANQNDLNRQLETQMASVANTNALSQQGRNALSNLTTQYNQSVGAILADPNMTPEVKQTQVNKLYETYQQSARSISAVYGIDASDLYPIPEAPPPTAPPLPPTTSTPAPTAAPTTDPLAGYNIPEWMKPGYVEVGGGA
jgi:hypothetical protein